MFFFLIFFLSCHLHKLNHPISNTCTQGMPQNQAAQWVFNASKLFKFLLAFLLYCVSVFWLLFGATDVFIFILLLLLSFFRLHKKCSLVFNFLTVYRIDPHTLAHTHANGHPVESFIFHFGQTENTQRELKREGERGWNKKRKLLVSFWWGSTQRWAHFSSAPHPPKSISPSLCLFFLSLSLCTHMFRLWEKT